MFDHAAQNSLDNELPWMIRVGTPQSVVLMKAMSQAVRLMSMAVTRRRRRAAGGQTWATDRIIAPAPHAGSQTVIGPSAGSDSTSPNIICAIKSQMVFGVWNSPFHCWPFEDRAKSM